MINIAYNSNVKYCDLEDFLKAKFVDFRCQKYVKKRVPGNEGDSLPGARKKCPRSLYFTLLSFDKGFHFCLGKFFCSFSISDIEK